MKNKFKFLVGTSLKRKIKTKWFLIANIFLALVIIGVGNIDNIIKFFGGDFSSITKIYVIDNTHASYDIFSNAVNNSNIEDENIELVLSDKTKDELIDLLNNEDSIILVIDYSDDIIKSELISNGYIDTLKTNIITSSLSSVKMYLAMEKYGISTEELENLTSPITIERTILDETKDSKEESMATIMTTVFPIFILPVFMLTIFLVQMIGAEVNDEKTTKGMEIIISNVSPKVHFFSKCVAGNLFILIQTGLLILYTVLAFLTRGIFTKGTSSNVLSSILDFIGPLFTSSFISSLKYLLPLMLVLIILTFIAYSLLAAILASMTTNTEDFQQLQSPIMMLTLIGYYLGIMAGTFKGATFIKILGYVPFISSILSPSLLLLGDFSIIDVLISILLVIITIFLLIKYGLRVYKVGILNYSQGNLFKKMFKALRQKN